MPIRQCKSRLIHDGRDLSLFTGGFSLDTSVKVHEYSTLQQCNTLRIPLGKGAAKMAQNGYFTTPDAGELEKELYDALGSSTGGLTTLVLGTGTSVPVGYTIDGSWNAELKLNTPVESIITLSGVWVGTDVLRGYTVFDGTISATGGQASVDFGSAGTSGGYAIIHVTGVVGTASNATFEIESSADGSTWATEGSATFSGVGATKITLSGTIDRYIRLNCTSLGGATSLTVVANVCVNGVTT